MEYFPRGGAKEKPVIRFKKFVFEKNKMQKSDKNTKSSSKPPLNRFMGHTEYNKKFYHAHLKYSDIAVGFQSICAVKSILKDRLFVNLPNELRAFVHYSSISSHFSKNSSSTPEKELSKMFYVGQLLSCKVIEKVPCEVLNASSIQTFVTIDPAAVNKNLNSGMINEHSMIQMTVSSLEDRGYMMDSGIAGIMAFLPIKEAVKYTKTVFATNSVLPIGTILWCYIVKANVNSCGAKFVEVRVCHNVSFELECNNSSNLLWPGSSVNTTITKVFDDGCCLVLVDDTNVQGTVNVQLDFSKDPSQPYLVGAIHKATVMTYNPLSDMYSFSFSHHVYKLMPQIDKAFNQLLIGTIVWLNKFVIFINLEEKQFMGITVVKSLSKKMENNRNNQPNDDERNPGEIDYKLGDHVKAKILSIDYIKRKYNCSIIEKIDSEVYEKCLEEIKIKRKKRGEYFSSDDEDLYNELESDSDFQLSYGTKIKNEPSLSDTQEDSGIETNKYKEKEKSKKKKSEEKKMKLSKSSEVLSESDLETDIKQEDIPFNENVIFNESNTNCNDKISTSSKSKKKNKKKHDDSIPEFIQLNEACENEGSRKRKKKSEFEDGIFKKSKGNKDGQNDLNAISQLSLQHVKAEYLWDATPEDLAKATSKPLEEFEEELEEEETIKKPLSKKEKKAHEIEKERLIREKEEELLKALDEPKSADHYERLILSRPDDSQVWIKYMAFHLESTEIEKARSVGNRALKLISHRNEQDRLNVWFALLNLEHLYGSKEIFKETWSEAVKCNDDFKVNCKVLEMYVEAQNLPEVIRLVHTMVKKYKDNLECWFACLSALMSAGVEEKARDLLQRALKYFPPKNHVTLISRFALIENSRSHSEEAQALFDNLLTSYPTRVDLWFVYIDMLIKSNQMDLARQVFERASSLKLPAKKMKSLYKKWLGFEEKHGTEESVEMVRKSAIEYVDRATKEIGT